MSDDPNIPLIKQIPLDSIASPHELRPTNPKDVRWYRPGFTDTFQLMGWRVIFFLPAVGLVAALFMLPSHLWLSQFLFVWWKLAVIAFVLPTGYAIKLWKNALQARTSPFCIHCGYDLTGMPDGHKCPE